MSDDIQIIFFSLHHIVIIATAEMKYEPPHDKTNNVAVCPAKTQIRLGGCPV